jgi:copper chaperone CopZ
LFVIVPEKHSSHYAANPININAVNQRVDPMEKLTLDLPAMYGDHHVLEVRRILLEMSGVSDVYASSCFHVVEVAYDPAQVRAEAIHAALEAAGYLEPLFVPLESEVASSQDGDQTIFFRHTAAYRQTGKVVSFAQQVASSGRPLWPCPGMGPLQRVDEGE